MDERCREYESWWQLRLDRSGEQGAGRPSLGSELEAHALGCAACRETEARFARLEQALALLAAPQVSSDFATRTLQAWADEPLVLLPVRSTSFSRRLGGRTLLAAAAGLLVMAGLWLGRGFINGPDQVAVRRPEPSKLPSSIAPPVPSLRLALAEATEATIELAETTSRPAARAGRQVLETADWTLGVPALAAAREAEPTPSSRSWLSIDGLAETKGEGLATALDPIARPARAAFGFLLPGGSRAPAAEPRDGT